MKLIHLSDLHLGKRVNEFSMVDDQKYILQQILQIVEGENPDGILIAGDIYDKTVPPAEAVQLCDEFLFRLSRTGHPVFLISGNHDSAERIAFGSRLMGRSGVYVSPVYDGWVEPVTLEDRYGAVDIFLLPFLKPAHVRRCFPEETVESYTDAVRTAIAHMAVDPARRSVLVTHQFVAGAACCASEEISVGGTDSVDAAVFAPFDYVALGHLHGPQRVDRDTVRYCGTPLKYSFSEAAHRKSVTVAELAKKGQVTLRTVPLSPLHDLREIRGTYMQLTDRRTYEGTAVTDYLHITLTDEEDVPDAVGRLRAIYPNLMKLDYDNCRTRSAATIDGAEAVERKTPLQLFGELYEKQNGQAMSEEQQRFTAALIETIWREGDPV